MAPNDNTSHYLEESVMIVNHRAEFHQVIVNVFIKEIQKEKKIWNSGSFFTQKLCKIVTLRVEKFLELGNHILSWEFGTFVHKPINFSIASH